MFLISKYRFILAFLIFALLTFAAVHISGLFSFVLFIPVFYILNYSNKRVHAIGFSLFCFITYAFAYTSWLFHCYNAITSSSLLLYVSLIMTIPVALSIFICRNKEIRLIFFCLFWLSMEYLQNHWDMGLPFYTLGNVFYRDKIFIQWYEYTGISGGSLWILIINVFLYNASAHNPKWVGYALCIIAIPLTGSLFLNHCNSNAQGQKINIITFYTNEKTKNQSTQSIIDSIRSILPNIHQNGTQFIFLPESTLKNYCRIESMESSYDYFRLKQSLCLIPNLSLISGAYINQGTSDNSDYCIEKTDNSRIKKFNGAIQINCRGFDYIVKNKLLPIEEYVPSNLKQRIGFDGFNRLLNIDAKHMFSFNTISVGVLICYEAAFGEYSSQHARNTDFLAMLSNEEMFSNTIANRQYLDLVSLRCIEQRKWMVKSSNKGYSAIIAPTGEIIKQLPLSNKMNALNSNVYSSRKVTFYSQYGDYIGLGALYTSIASIIVMALFQIRKFRAQE